MALHPYPDSIPPEAYTAVANAIFSRQFDARYLSHLGWHIVGYIAGKQFSDAPQAMAITSAPIPQEEIRDLTTRAPSQPTIGELELLKRALYSIS
jgi:hypothetical protein